MHTNVFQRLTTQRASSAARLQRCGACTDSHPQHGPEYACIGRRLCERLINISVAALDRRFGLGGTGMIVVWFGSRASRQRSRDGQTMLPASRLRVSVKDAGPTQTGFRRSCRRGRSSDVATRTRARRPVPSSEGALLLSIHSSSPSPALARIVWRVRRSCTNTSQTRLMSRWSSSQWSIQSRSDARD